MEPDMDDLRPNLSTLRVFNEEGRTYRVYMTIGGNPVCERFNPQTQQWVLVPLRCATEAEVRQLMAIRRATGDEEVAETLSAYGRG